VPGERTLRENASDSFDKEEELKSSPTVKESFIDAKKQLAFYFNGLMNKFGSQLKLKQYAVVSIGFDRLFFEEVSYKK
jgi:hypothetical protein